MDNDVIYKRGGDEAGCRGAEVGARDGGGLDSERGDGEEGFFFFGEVLLANWIRGLEFMLYEGISTCMKPSKDKKQHCQRQWNHNTPGQPAR